MALGFNSNLFNTHAASRSSETAGVVASSSETAGTIAAAGSETAGLIASNAAIDSFQSNNPFAPQIDYSQYSSAPETAGSLASETAGSLASETAGTVAFGDVETAGCVADAGCETAGSVASSDSGFGSFDSGFVC